MYLTCHFKNRDDGINELPASPADLASCLGIPGCDGSIQAIWVELQLAEHRRMTDCRSRIARAYDGSERFPIMLSLSDRKPAIIISSVGSVGPVEQPLTKLAEPLLNALAANG